MKCHRILIIGNNLTKSSIEYFANEVNIDLKNKNVISWRKKQDGYEICEQRWKDGNLIEMTHLREGFNSKDSQSPRQ